jgi:hypothetical protein
MTEKVLSREEALRARAVIDGFFNDETVKGAMERTERRFIEEMIDADTSEKRAAAQGKIRALRALLMELRIIFDAGERAMIEIAQQAKAEAMKRKESGTQ